jgi:hypothetical protein
MKVVLFIFYSFVTLYFIVNLEEKEGVGLAYWLGRCLACMSWPIMVLWMLLDVIFKKNDTSMKF